MSTTTGQKNCKLHLIRLPDRDTKRCSARFCLFQHFAPDVVLTDSFPDGIRLVVCLATYAWLVCWSKMQSILLIQGVLLYGGCSPWGENWGHGRKLGTADRGLYFMGPIYLVARI